MKPLEALRNQPPGSYFVAAKDQTKDQDPAYVIHWIKPNKAVESVQFLKVKDGLTRKGSKNKRVYKDINDFLEIKKEHFTNPVSNTFEPANTSDDSLTYEEPEEADVIDLETQLRRLEFYVGYMEGQQCNIALSKYPTGTYLLRRTTKDTFLRLSYVTKEGNHQKDIKHLQLKEKEDANDIIDFISNMDGPTVPYSPNE